tara:strand:+ start:11352 stop:12134 length:783 start_codon:yes stop_codon:yes gene_type:complete
MKKINLGILGPKGRMGQSIIKESEGFPEIKLSALCEKPDHEDVGKIYHGLKIIDDIEELVIKSEVIIDFTSPLSTLNLIDCLRKKKDTALIVGTTGFNKEQENIFLENINGLKILRSSNMSLGVNLAFHLTEIISGKLGENVDVEIVESHHKYKKDAPSGTALTLGEHVNKGRNKSSTGKFVYRGINFESERASGDIGFSSIRGGDVVGEHSVMFLMDGERIQLSHMASSRKIFSQGALKASLWIRNQSPGLYSVKDMLI